jgi:hypothetical protein
MQCYYPDGELAAGLTPCNPTAEVSHCCSSSDMCLTNGFCYSLGLNSIVQRGCTDSSFGSSECPQQCINIGNITQSTTVSRKKNLNAQYQKRTDLCLTRCVTRWRKTPRRCSDVVVRAVYFILLPPRRSRSKLLRLRKWRGCPVRLSYSWLRYTRWLERQRLRRSNCHHHHATDPVVYRPFELNSGVW